jgi:hypothetical protein
MADVAASMAACAGRIPGILAALVDAGTAYRQVGPPPPDDY